MGLGSASILTSFFRVKNDKTTRKGEQILEILDSSEVGILAAWAASRVTSWSDPVLPENPGFQMETHGRTTKVGKPEVYRQTRQKTRVLLVRVYNGIYHIINKYINNVGNWLIFLLPQVAYVGGDTSKSFTWSLAETFSRSRC